MIELIVMAVLAGLVLVVQLSRALRRKKVLEAVERASMKWGLAITPDVLPVLLRRRRASGIGYAIGTSVGVLGGYAILVVALHRTWNVADGLLPQVFWLTTGGCGALLGGAIGGRHARLPGRRIARDRAVTILDYIDPVERRASWTVAAVALAVGLIPLVRGERGSEALLATVLGLVAVAVVACASLLAKVILSRPQRADSTAALAWDDALRAETVRYLVEATAAFALLSLAMATPIALASIGMRADRDSAQLGVLWGAIAVFIVGAIWAMRQRPARYFLRRLWPDTAAEADANERAAMGVPQ